jgi:cytochrome c553
MPEKLYRELLMLMYSKFNKIGYLLLSLVISSLFLVACGDTPTVPPSTPTPTTAPVTTTAAPTPTVAPVKTTVPVPTATPLVITIAASTTASVTTTIAASTTVAPVTTTVAPPTTLAASGDAVNGKKLFGEVGCSACHGPLAQGDYGPKIAGTRLSYEQVLQQVRHPKGKGPNVMTPFSPEEVSDKDVADVYAYLQTLK